MRKDNLHWPVPCAAGIGRRGVDGHLGYLLRQAATVHRNAMDDTLSDLGVTAPQFSVLTMIGAYPGCSNAELSELTLLTPPTVTVIISNLIAMGAVVRRPHIKHRRILHIDLTPDGTTLLAACRTRVQVLEQGLASQLLGLDESSIREWLVRIAQPTASQEWTEQTPADDAIGAVPTIS